jgi:hypothetical protein
MADQPPLRRPEGSPWGTFRFKSDLRNHQAIVQPRLCDFFWKAYLSITGKQPLTAHETQFTLRCQAGTTPIGCAIA